MIHIQKPSARQHSATAEEEEEDEDEDDSILDSDDEYVEDEDADEDLVRYVETQKQGVESLQPGKTVYPVTPRKRPSQELEPDDTSGGLDGDVFMDGRTQDDARRVNNGTPPKRARVDGGYEPSPVAKIHPPSPTPPSKTSLERETKKARTPLPLPRTPGVVRE